ncbi:MAG: type 4a pilus biogenesis protein PilO, partial [Candidatus Binatota bacterium]
RDKKKKEAANIPKLKEQMAQLDGMLKEAVAQLPDRKEIPDLLSSISNKVKESGLDILIFRPRAENIQEFYAEIPVDIVVRGGFHNVATFFDEVGRLNRLVNIANIELRNPKANEDQVIMEVSTVATTFRFLDEAERAKIAAERAAKEKAAKK